MFQRDYLLRMVEQAAQALTRALRLLAEKKTIQAEQELNEAYAALQMDPELLALLDPATLRNQWSDDAQLAMACRLLLCDAELQRTKGDEPAASRRWRGARKLHRELKTPDEELSRELARVSAALGRT